MVMEGESVATTSEGVGTEADTATIKIKIKTLDSQTYTLRVNKQVPVPQLKEQIAGVTGIESRQQRLICRGQVLRDNELLSHYHVEDGHTLHLVVRQPPESMPNPGAADGSSVAVNNQGNPVIDSIVLEAINIQHRSRGFPNIGQIISSIINSLGTSAGASLGMDRVAGAANSEPQPAESTEPYLNPRSFTVEIGSMRVPSQTQSAETPSGSVNPSPIPDSLATISQYLQFMNEEFRRAGFVGQIDSFTPVGHGYGTQSVSNLAHALVSTRSLMTQAQICLSELAAQLSEHTNVTPAQARAQLQALSVRSGILMQNLGSLLLELGRNAIMLHTGPTPDYITGLWVGGKLGKINVTSHMEQDASVNAGPAMFISGNGPNPLMVQPVPFFPSSSLAGHTGDLYSSRGVHSDFSRTLLRPRNIDIHIRAGRGAPTPSGANQSGETGGETDTQTQEQPAAARNSGSTNQGHNGEPGIRMVPLPVRMVALPVLARVPVRGDSGGVVPPASEASNGRSQPNLDHVMQGLNVANGTDPLVYAPGGPLNSESVDMATLLQEWLRAADVVDPFQVRGSGTTHQEPLINASPAAPPHASGGTRIPEATSGVPEEGIQFSNLLRQVLPVVSQIVDATSSASPAQASVDGFNGHAQRNSNASRSLDNPEEGPSAKRQRKNG